MGKQINNKDIAILMATYNGERFLKEQIDSIINQTIDNWTLFIQDDGSCDRTIDIIKNYNDNRIILIDNGLSHQGVCENFMTLLNVVESRFYMFCDQDDVWFPNKIEKLFEHMLKLEKDNPNKPILVYSDKSRTDEQLNVIYEREFARSGISQDKISKIIETRNTTDMLLLRSTAAGCTMMFNHKSKEVSIPYINVRYHDSIVAIAIAKNNGIISTILDSTMYYRVHSHNTVGISGDVPINKKMSKIMNVIKGNILAYRLWKLYGGGSFFRFIRAKYRLFKTRYI